MIFEPAFLDSSRPGMCMRDYIAIKAMAAFLAGSKAPSPEDFGTIAADAYKMADAMLEARQRQVASYQV